MATIDIKPKDVIMPLDIIFRKRKQVQEDEIKNVVEQERKRLKEIQEVDDPHDKGSEW